MGKTLSQWAIFGSRLQQAYAAVGLSRAAFARTLGVGYNTVWRWEQGQNEPQPEALIAMRSTMPADSFAALFEGLELGATVDAILSRPEQFIRSAPPAAVGRTTITLGTGDRELDLMHHLATLDADTWARVRAWVDARHAARREGDD